MKLDLEIYQWLLKLGIMKEMAVTESFIQLDQQQYDSFMQGNYIAQMLKALANISIECKIGNTPGIKLFNWNNISAALEKIDVSFDDDIKMAILKGDWEMLQELLRELKLHFDKSTFVEQQLSLNQSTVVTTEQTEIMVDEINPNKPLFETQSLLELILTSLAKHFNLKPKQAVILLNNSYKQLSEYLIQGYHKSYKIPINWLIDLSKNTQIILRFQFTLDTFFSLIRGGLVSKSPEVTYWTIFIYQNIVSELSGQSNEDIYAWFVREHGGLIATILATKRHPQFIEQICNLYGMVSQYNINEFFDVQLRKLLKSGKEYIDFINSIIESLKIRDQLMEKGLMEFFSMKAFKLFEPQHSYMERMSSLKYLEYYWIFYPQQFETNNVDAYLFNARKATRDQSFTLRIFTFQSLFRILDHLALQKNKYATLLYKKLVFSLIEYFDEKEVREFLVANFLMIIKKYSAIPIDILLVPMIKQLQLYFQGVSSFLQQPVDRNNIDSQGNLLIPQENEPEINIGDFQLLREMCTHPKLELSVAIQMLDMLCKFYLNSIIFHQLTFQQIQLLMARFIEQPITREFAQNVCKIGLTQYYGSYCESLKNYPKTFINTNNSDNKILQQQLRSQIIQLVKYIINLRQFDLNEQIKQIVLHFYIEIQQNMKTESKALIMLLGYFGDIPELLKQYSKPIETTPQSKIILKSQPQQKQNKSIIPDPFKQLRDSSTKTTNNYPTMLQGLSLSFDEQQLLKQFDML